VNLNRTGGVSCGEGLRRNSKLHELPDTYSDCRKDILKLVDQRDQAGIVDVYTVTTDQSGNALGYRVRGARGLAHEVGLAMAGSKYKRQSLQTKRGN
jgi:hypothetical protein